MAIKFNKGKVRLWTGVKAGNTNIGIRFHRDIDAKEIEEIHKMVQSFLESKYGKGVE